MRIRRFNPWLELVVYLLIFALAGVALYAIKRQIKGLPRPSYVPQNELPATVSTRPG